MTWPQFSLRSLFGAGTLLAIACGTVLEPWHSWCPAAVLTGTLLTLLVAGPAACYSHGRGRAYWIGFSTAGWGYLVLAYAPWFESHVGRHLLAPCLAERACLAITGSFGDYPHYLDAVQSMSLLCAALVGGFTVSRCCASPEPILVESGPADQRRTKLAAVMGSSFSGNLDPGVPR